MKKTISLLIISILCFNLVACSNTEQPNPIKVDPPTTENDSTFVQSLNRFAFDSSAILLSKKENSNYSPLSLYIALAMLTTGSNSTTQTELLNALQVENLDYLVNETSLLLQHIYYADDLSVANGMWIKNDFIIQDSYKETLQKKFFAEVYSVDFGNEADLNQITSWVKENTNQRINLDLKKEDIEDNVLMLINTIYYNSQWETPFNSKLNTIDSFYLIDNTSIEKEYMHKRESHSILQNDTYLASYLDLNEGKMYFILPEEGIEITSLLNSDTFLSLLDSSNYQAAEINYQIPKFEYNNHYQLIDLLKELGVVEVFDERSDLSGIADDLYVSSIIQDTFIKIDETGAEAAGATTIGVNETSAPLDPEPIIDFILNRPFLYFITDGTGIITFIGTYYGNE